MLFRSATKAKVKETALRVSSVANDAKKKAIDVIGEENVKEAKEKVKDTVNDAKDAIKDKVNPSTEDFDDFDKPASNPEPATTEEVDIPKVKKDEGIDFMEDELSDL